MADITLLVPKIKKFEGGLSKAKTDSASSDPVPDGSGYHTNKGITWKTFKSMANIVGYTATPQLFYAMPDSIWMAILKKGYWDKVQGNLLRSQSIAEMVTDAIWAGAYNAKYAVKEIQSLLKSYGYQIKVDGILGLNTASAINDAILHGLESKMLEAAYNGRKKHFEMLGGANLAGWMNRLNSLYNQVLAYIGKTVSILKKKVMLQLL